MDLAEPTLILLATLLMIAALILSFVPILPGPLLVWAVTIIFAVIEGFQRITPAAAIGATAIMVLGSASDLWLPIFGIRTGGLTCLSTIGAFIGGFIGTFAFPILGTLIGSVAGALLVELFRFREVQKALRAGTTAAKMYVLGYIVQLVASVAIFAVYVVSLQTTR